MLHECHGNGTVSGNRWRSVLCCSENESMESMLHFTFFLSRIRSWDCSKFLLRHYSNLTNTQPSSVDICFLIVFKRSALLLQILQVVYHFLSLPTMSRISSPIIHPAIASPWLTETNTNVIFHYLSEILIFSTRALILSHVVTIMMTRCLNND